MHRLAPTTRRFRRVMAVVLLFLHLSLHAAVVFPELHHFWHSCEDEHAECHEEDCAVVAFANGTVDPGPLPVAPLRPFMVPLPAVLEYRDPATTGSDSTEPPGRGPPLG